MRFKLTIEKYLYVILLISGTFYVLNAWSPSSYGFFLESMNVQDPGIVFGKPREIRTDEWAFLTPMFQALVNSGFSTVNTTSLYNESFIMHYGLPILDLGLIFKPTMWGFIFLSPAYAYSLHWFLLFAVFIIGYFKLFNEIGFKQDLSILLSFLLCFSGFSQFWWSVNAATFAIFPWIIYILIYKGNLNLILRLLLFYWLSVSWLLMNVYPPFILSLIFVGILIFINFGHFWFSWKRLILLAIISCFAILSGILYLKEYIQDISNTIYPGLRSISGGTTYSFKEFLSQFQPFLLYDISFNAAEKNISEIGSITLPFFIMALCHLDYRSLRNINFNKKVIIIFTIGLLLMLSWMLLPIPNFIGKFLFFDKIPPERMSYAQGFLLIIWFCFVAMNLKYIISFERFLIYSSIVSIIWFLVTKPYFGMRLSAMLDLGLILFLLVAYYLIYKYHINIFTSFVLVSTIYIVSINSYFNPIQNSKMIFQNHPEIKEKLDPLVDEHGILTIPNFRGSLLNGIGYKSVSHTLAVPKLDFWKKLYPQMSDIDINYLFNRFAHIGLSNDINRPELLAADYVVIPLSDFYSRFKSDNLIKNKFSEKDILYGIEELHNKSQLTGSFNVPNGNIKIIEILIGNYNNQSDGKLHIRLCSEKCVDGYLDINKSIDNSYSTVKLDSKLSVTNQNITYQIELLDSKKPFAIYSLYNANKLIAPRVNLIYEKNR